LAAVIVILCINVCTAHSSKQQHLHAVVMPVAATAAAAAAAAAAAVFLIRIVADDIVTPCGASTIRSIEDIVCRRGSSASCLL